MINFLLAGVLIVALSVFIGTTFGSKGRHDNNADMIAAILFGAGLGCVVMWFITVIAKALAT